MGVSASILRSGLKKQSMFVSGLHILVNLPTLVKPHHSLRIGMVEIDICAKLYFVCGTMWMLNLPKSEYVILTNILRTSFKGIPLKALP